MRIACVTLLSAMILGCGPVNPATETVLAPGARATLAYVTAFGAKGVSVVSKSFEDSSGHVREVERTETPYEEKVEFRHELDVHVVQGEDEALVVELSPRRAWVRGKEVPTDPPPAAGAGNWQHIPGEGDSEEYRALMASRFRATVRDGQLTRLDPSGPGFPEPESEGPDWQRSAIAGSAGVGQALADALAYAPPVDAKAGTAWQVRRDCVIPYAPYAFYMLTSGAITMTEHTYCRVASVQQTPTGSVAEIRLSGQRKPGMPESSMPRRVSHLSLEGTGRANLDTGEWLDLRIRTRPHFIHLEDTLMLNIEFVNDIRLVLQP